MKTQLTLLETPDDMAESTALLRETLERYVRDLAEELLYWVEQLNLIDDGSAAAPPDEIGHTAKPAGGDWAARRGHPRRKSGAGRSAHNCHN